MSKHDDFYWKMKPGKHHMTTRSLSLEARGVLVDYQNAMSERDGTVPDERTAEGLQWHMTMIGLRDRRTLRRLIDELMQKEHLERLPDGRLTNAEIVHQLAKRGRKPKATEASARPGKPPLLQMMEVDDCPHQPVDIPVGERGTAGEMAARCPSDAHLATVSGRKSEQNQRPVSSCIAEHIHEVVVVMSRWFSARARAVIAGPWARAGPLPAPA